ncbi:hypothetical protein [Streptomyces sp. TP-A0356]|uniref:hypothetical protein n=1 Tax=Streptomyces sp. TP-A0356 TaxID=1359208 RepID=UPI0006E2F400|nr:hypothetical protein [Streptomyces sp. TP-A0356]
MSALTHHGVRHTTSVRPVGALLSFFTRVVRRLADSPLDHTVLHAAPARTSTPLRAAGFGPGRPHAHWHTVTGPDGHRRLEARWHGGA